MKKAIIITTIAAMFAAAACLAGFCYLKSKTVIINGTEYRPELALDGITAAYAAENPMFLLNGTPIEDLNASVKHSADVSAIQSRDFFTRAMDGIRRRSYDVPVTAEIDRDVLKAWVESYNSKQQAPADAYIDRDGRFYSIVPEVKGTMLDLERILADAGFVGFDIGSYVVKPKIVKEDLEAEASRINGFAAFKIEYGNGAYVEAPEEAVFYKNGELSLETEWIAAAVKEAVKGYNTVGNEWDFITTGGESIKVKGGTWGSKVDLEKEAAFVKESFEKGESSSGRVPEFQFSREEIGDTYIEISLSQQHVWHYKDWELARESDCVTGNTGLKRGTPSGVYYVTERIPGKYLIGDDYKTWVNRWMRLTNSGIGLHDATWRWKFGGEIYKRDGSHGCINLPKQFAYDLFDDIKNGIPVIIY